MSYLLMNKIILVILFEYNTQIVVLKWFSVILVTNRLTCYTISDNSYFNLDRHNYLKIRIVQSLEKKQNIKNYFFMYILLYNELC